MKLSVYLTNKKKLFALLQRGTSNALCCSDEIVQTGRLACCFRDVKDLLAARSSMNIFLHCF
jgi:hypothetical protein